MLPWLQAFRAPYMAEKCETRLIENRMEGRRMKFPRISLREWKKRGIIRDIKFLTT